MFLKCWKLSSHSHLQTLDKEQNFSLREEHRLKVFENRVLRRIFGLKGDEIVGGWRKLNKEELHNLCSSPNITRMVKRPLGIPRHK
jgi:hypothetical protein